MKKVVPAIHIVAGIISAWFCLSSIFLAVWGVQVSWIVFVGLLASIGLISGGGIALFSPIRGRLLSAVSLVAMGIVYIPGAVDLVPADTIIVSAIPYVFEGAYFVLLGLALLHPSSGRVGRLVYASMVVAFVAVLAGTGWARWRSGEFNRPQLVFIIRDGNSAELSLGPGDDSFYGGGIRQTLANYGITGRLRFSGGWNSNSHVLKMIVIASGPIPKPVQLFYPKHQNIVYEWNGREWSHKPENAETYPAYATLQPTGMLEMELTSGGVEGTTAFKWY